MFEENQAGGLIARKKNQNKKNSLDATESANQTSKVETDLRPLARTGLFRDAKGVEADLIDSAHARTMHAASLLARKKVEVIFVDNLFTIVRMCRF